MSSYKINTRYAKALFQIALEEHLLEATYADMLLLSEVCKGNREFLLLLKNPTISLTKRIAILTELFQGRFSPFSLQYILFVVRKNRGINLKGISDAFIDLYKEYNNLKTIYVQTSTAFDEKDKQQLIQKIEQFLNKTITVEETVKPELIGGFCVRFDDYLYDTSFSGKITKLKKEFEKNDYQK